MRASGRRARSGLRSALGGGSRGVDLALRASSAPRDSSAAFRLAAVGSATAAAAAPSPKDARPERPTSVRPDLPGGGDDLRSCY